VDHLVQLTGEGAQAPLSEAGVKVRDFLHIDLGDLHQGLAQVSTEKNEQQRWRRNWHFYKRDTFNSFLSVHVFKKCKKYFSALDILLNL